MLCWTLCERTEVALVVTPHQVTRSGIVVPIVLLVTNFVSGVSVSGLVELPPWPGRLIVTATLFVLVDEPSLIVYENTSPPVVHAAGS